MTSQISIEAHGADIRVTDPVAPYEVTVKKGDLGVVHVWAGRSLLIEEVPEADSDAVVTGYEFLLDLFRYKHLPLPLQGHSKPFHSLAHHLAQTMPPGRLLDEALLRLWETKNLAVVAHAASSPKGT